MGTPIFGTQNISITGNVIIELDLLLADSCGIESVFTVATSVNVANACQPLVLTNFFEICMPSTTDTAFLPRFTEFCNSACEARLATNNCGRDLTIDADGQVTANLIIALCISCATRRKEKDGRLHQKFHRISTTLSFPSFVTIIFFINRSAASTVSIVILEYS